MTLENQMYAVWALVLALMLGIVFIRGTFAKVSLAVFLVLVMLAALQLHQRL